MDRSRCSRGFLLCASGVLVMIAFGCAATPRVSETEYSKLPKMEITAGLQDRQVIQRDEHNQGTIRCEGTSPVDGEVWGNVGYVKSGVVVVAWHRVGEARGGKWSASIPGVPVGARYAVFLQIRDNSSRQLTKTSDVYNIMVGDLWILAGQSNMEGYGELMNVEAPSPYVHSYGLNEKWAVAEEPLHWLVDSPDACHHPGKTPEQIEAERKAPHPTRDRGAGLALPFAKELYARTKVPMGLIPCAHGGTSMHQWRPDVPPPLGDSLYGSMLKRFQATGGKIKGVLWYQGEGEANEKNQKVYRERMTQFIARIRKDFGDPQLPFYMVQISRVTLPNFSASAWGAVREDERILGQTIPGVATVSAMDLDLDDIIHIGTAGLKRLGRRLAIVADHEIYGNGSVRTGPRLKSATVEKGNMVRVVFENVNGRLRPEQHIAGFSLRTADGKPGPEFYDVIVDPKDPNAVLCQVQYTDPSGMCLWYGYGLNPYCNLTDEQDMAVPAFGPIPLGSTATQPK